MLPDDHARVLVAHVGDHVELRGPEGKLSLPVDEGGQRHSDEERSSAVALLVEGVKEGDGLDGLAEAHLVGEDDVGVVAPGVAGPGDALQLVGVEGQALGQPLARGIVLRKYYTDNTLVINILVRNS